MGLLLARFMAYPQLHLGPKLGEGEFIGEYEKLSYTNRYCLLIRMFSFLALTVSN